ncbi:MAG: glycosyltransferase family 2 protein, partial [bacterium]|nr:glycosyltransferase family 2 protein [bacterium]
MDHAEDGPLISVVIPTYMRASSVARALDSIIEPNIDPARIQVIVVDNASTDDTSAVVDAHRSRLPGLEFHSWPTNVGPLENWKRGVALARAPWLKVLWSDDQLEPRAIEHMLFAAERYDARVVTCRVLIEYPDGQTVTRYLDRPTTLTPDIVISELLHFPAGLPSSPAAVLIRTDDAITALD